MLPTRLEKRTVELKQRDKEVKGGLTLCSKMREMIQELDQEKQAAAQRLLWCVVFGVVYVNTACLTLTSELLH